ncbi:hypothetical protein RUND412_000728 [Rhizina undulata]
MLSIQLSKSAPKHVNCNILPCRVKHTGSANATEKHWKITSAKDDTKTTYFRGRKLQGKSIALPTGYSGHILEATDEVVNSSDMNDRDGEVDDEPETKNFKSRASFSEITVWGHETAPEHDSDGVFKGLNEWIAFSSKIHDFDMEENGENEKIE